MVITGTVTYKINNCMKLIKICLLTIAFSLALTADAQDQQTLQDISFYADITANAGLPQSRAMAAEELDIRLSSWLASDDYSLAALEQIAYISVKAPEDESFAIVTWPVRNEQNSSSYYGYIRKANGKVIKLNAANADHSVKELPYMQLSAADWYGALYYNMLPTKVNGKEAYLLFGFDGHEGYEHRKLMDVLTWDGDEPVFGAEIFRKENTGRRNDVAMRILLEYSNDANVSLNYNQGLDMVTHDHLINRMGRIPGQGPTLLPDGSYVGYKWDGEYWNYVDKIYDFVSEEPPTDGRTRPTGGRDILGKEKIVKEKKSRD